MKYAIIKSGGKQYKVEENSVINIDRIEASKDSVFEFKEVLFLRDGEDVSIGNPLVSGSKVVGKVIGNVRGEKLYIGKYKAKVHYRRRTGFRADYTSIQIERIGKGELREKDKLRKNPKK